MHLVKLVILVDNNVDDLKEEEEEADVADVADGLCLLPQ